MNDPSPAELPVPKPNAGEVRSHLRFLAEAAHDLNSSLKLDDVFQKIAQRVQKLVDCHLFCVMLWNEDLEGLEHSYSLKFGQHVVQDGFFPLGYGISGHCARDRKPIRVADVSRDPRYVRFRHAEIEVTSELAVPLIFQDRLIGVLDLESMESGLFTEEHEAVLMALAFHIATALENARLYEKLLANEQRLERDLAAAREIQKGLMPLHPPQLDGYDIGCAYSPARELAGDFYDFLPYGDGRWAIAVGDVAGKSTPAALYGSLAVGMLRGNVVQRPTAPAEMLALLNGQMMGIQMQERFLALMFGILDPPRRKLQLSSAGFPYTRLLRNGSVETIALSGLPLGIFDNTEYDELQIDLRPNDVVVITSDGVEDCRDQQEAPVEYGRLDGWLRRLNGKTAQDLADHLMQMSTPQIEDGGGVLDDRTIVIIRVLD